MRECKICNSSVRTIQDKRRAIGYFRCESCGFIALDEVHLIDAKSERQHYEKHENSLACDGYVRMFEEFIEIAILPYHAKSDTVLDFGCGHTPVLTELLKRHGFSVDIYDIYFYPEKIYKDKEYNMIISTEVFEHLKSPMETLQELVSSLKMGGYIILMTQFPHKTDEEFLEWWYRRDVTHISFFTPHSFEIMAKRVGLNLIKTMNDNIVVFQKPC